VCIELFLFLNYFLRKIAEDLVLDEGKKIPCLSVYLNNFYN